MSTGVLLVRVSALPTPVMILSFLPIVSLVVVMNALFPSGSYVVYQQPVKGIKLMAAMLLSFSLVYPSKHYGVVETL